MSTDQQKWLEGHCPAIQILQESRGDASSCGEVNDAQRPEMPFVEQPAASHWIRAARDGIPTPDHETESGHEENGP